VADTADTPDPRSWNYALLDFGATLKRQPQPSQHLLQPPIRLRRLSSPKAGRTGANRLRCSRGHLPCTSQARLGCS
jgi:hypothetical protein